MQSREQNVYSNVHGSSSGFFPFTPFHPNVAAQHCPIRPVPQLAHPNSTHSHTSSYSEMQTESPMPPQSFPTSTTNINSSHTHTAPLQSLRSVDPNTQLVHVVLNNGQSLTVTLAEYEELSAGFTKGPVPQMPTMSELQQFSQPQFVEETERIRAQVDKEPTPVQKNHPEDSYPKCTNNTLRISSDMAYRSVVSPELIPAYTPPLQYPLMGNDVCAQTSSFQSGVNRAFMNTFTRSSNAFADIRPMYTYHMKETQGCPPPFTGPSQEVHNMCMPCPNASETLSTAPQVLTAAAAEVIAAAKANAPVKSPTSFTPTYDFESQTAFNNLALISPVPARLETVKEKESEECEEVDVVSRDEPIEEIDVLPTNRTDDEISETEEEEIGSEIDEDGYEEVQMEMQEDTTEEETSEEGNHLEKVMELSNNSNSEEEEYAKKEYKSFSDSTSETNHNEESNSKSVITYASTPSPKPTSLDNTLESSTFISRIKWRSSDVVVDGVNLEEVRQFAMCFKLSRIRLGLTQQEVGQALSHTEGPAYSQSAICRFEKLEITPRSAQRIMPVLKAWITDRENGKDREYEFADSNSSFEIIGGCRKRRKRRTSFPPQALNVLTDFFAKTTHPSPKELDDLSEQLHLSKEVIRVWFCNRRQSVRTNEKRADKTCKNVRKR